MAFDVESVNPELPWQPAVSFQSEIKGMMYVFGDDKNVSDESSKLVESIVHQRMTQLLQSLEVITSLREGQCAGLEDVFFLFRNDPVKAKHLASLLKVKEDVSKVSGSSSAAGDIQPASGTPVYEDQVFTRSKVDSLPQNVKPLFELPGGISVLDIDTSIDWLQKERMKRADILTEQMSTDEYMDYTKLRCISYHKNHKKFRDWLNHPVVLDLKVSHSVIEILGIICYEITREVVELSLTVKFENESKSHLYTSRPLPRDLMMDVSQSSLVVQAINWTSGTGSTSSDQKNSKSTGRSGMQPAHIREAIRRLRQCTSSFSRPWHAVELYC